MKREYQIRIVSYLLAFFALVILAFPESGRSQGENELPANTIISVVKNKLSKQRILKNNDITVSVKDRIITLSGTVQSIGAKIQAGRDAAAAEESYRVNNQLVIKAMNMTNQQLTDSVVAALQRRVFYSIFDWVTVSSDNGNVTLNGWVYEPWHKSEFVSQAQKVPGVRAVADSLIVLPKSSFDDQIRIHAARLIYDNPVFEPYAYELVPSIHIIVRDGNVVLEGVVKSQSDSDLAENLISLHTDAYSVDNELKILNK